eukprot:COSAG05_NODE_295_length_11962_cov_6.608952_4_plen_86_part_00
MKDNHSVRARKWRDEASREARACSIDIDTHNHTHNNNEDDQDDGGGGGEEETANPGRLLLLLLLPPRLLGHKGTTRRTKMENGGQ